MADIAYRQSVNGYDTMYFGFIYNSTDTKWDFVSYAVQD